MACLEWSDELNTGINVIDNQHKQIVDYINRMHTAIEAGERSEILEIFEALVDYTITHFTFEESLLVKAGYEFSQAHQRVHQVFIKKLHGLKTKYEQGEDAVAGQVNQMLKRWLLSHIKNDDADYVPAVRKIMHTEEKSGWLSRSLKRLFKSEAA